MSDKTRHALGARVSLTRGRASVPRHYLAVQHAVSQILAEAPTLPEASRRILEAIGSSLRWEVGALWEHDAHADVLRCVDVWCAPHARADAFMAKTRASTFAPGIGLPGRIWSSHMPAWVPDVLQDGNFPRAPFAAKEGLHGAFGFPIALGGYVLGAVEFFSHEFREPDEELLRLMASIGSQIGQFIDRQRATETVRVSEARKAAVLESALDAIVAIDDRGVIQEFNPAAERMFGYTRAEAVGREMAELIVPERLREAHRRGLDRYQSTGKGTVLGSRIEMPALKADGTEFQVELSITHIPLAGPPMFTGYLRDITARKHAEREREDLLHREQAAREDAERANRLKDEFLATLSHELRTPLTAILGWVRMLRAGTLDAGLAGRALDSVERNASLQARLVSDLLDTSQILNGKLRLDVRPTELVSVVDGALEAVRPASEAKGIQLVASLDPSVGTILADGDRLQQVIWNLLANAIKFTPSGGRVEVRTERQGKRVEITVSDTGQGITSEFLPFVFDRFRQADGSTTRRHAGLGLGLAIVRHLVEMHGGTVRASSEGPDAGATFAVCLPIVAESPDSTSLDFAATHTLLNRSLLRGRHILVVDDDPDTRQLIVAILESSGARVTAAAGVPEAVALFQRTPVDVLLADIEMPDHDGYALIRQLRALEAPGPCTPAIALSAHARPDDRARALAAGYARHIPKPFEPADVVAAVASLAAASDGLPSG